ncbi:MAG: substrate-binding periplasmic protein [Casimicrobiaceae bacterium]
MAEPLASTPDRARRCLLRFGVCLPALLVSGFAVAETTELDRIRARGTLKIALYKDNPPYSSGPATRLRGLDVDLADALARGLGLKLELLPFDAGESVKDDLRNMVWRGHYLGYGPADVMLHVPADARLARGNPQVAIIEPYLREQLVLLYDSERIRTVERAEDLKELPLAAERGTGAASMLIGYGGGLLRAQVGLYRDGVEAARAVLDGKAAAAYLTRAQAEAALFERSPAVGRYRLAALGLGHVHAEQGWAIGMAIKAEHRALGRALEGVMTDLRASGELRELFRKHGLTLVAP